MELRRAQQADARIRVLDVRTASEFENAHIAGAYNVPLDLLAEHAADLRDASGGAVVLELRERRIGGALSGDKLEEILNDQARQGWQLKAITSVEVKRRIGPGGVEGVLVTFERPVI